MSHLCHGLIIFNAYRNYSAILNFKFGECQMLVEKELKKYIQKTHEPVQHHPFECSTLN